MYQGTELTEPMVKAVKKRASNADLNLVVSRYFYLSSTQLKLLVSFFILLASLLSVCFVVVLHGRILRCCACTKRAHCQFF